MNSILAQNSGQSLEQIAKDTDRDFYMSAKEAKEYGLIDKVLEKMWSDCMALLEIIHYPSKILRTISKEIVSFDSKLHQQLDDMHETMIASEDRVSRYSSGLAFKNAHYQSPTRRRRATQRRLLRNH